MFDTSQNSVIIDADGCPVAKLAAKLCSEFNASCVLVCDSAHIFSPDSVYNAKVVTVSQGADSADFFIVNHIKENDIVITQDYGLAAMCLSKKAAVINQNGQIYSDSNIGGLLEARAIGKKIRRSGGRTKGPPKRTAQQDKHFEDTLRRLLTDGKKI